MAKKIRFPLDMGNGIEVRTLEELQENFSVEKVLGYYADGKLITWLRDRYLDDIAGVINELDKDDSDFVKKICNAFGVDYDEEVDIEALEERNRKLALLKQYTEEKKYYDVVGDIAFDQDELYDLLDEGKTTIYLCGKQFSIPLGKRNMKYIGVNNPVVVINTKEIVNWNEKDIQLIDIRFDGAYQSLIDKPDREVIYSMYEERVRNIECYLYERPFSMLGWKFPSQGSITGKMDEVQSRVKQEFGKLKRLIGTVCENTNNKELDNLIDKYISSYKDNLRDKILIEGGEGELDTFTTELDEFMSMYEEIRKNICETVQRYGANQLDEMFDLDFLEEVASEDSFTYGEDYMLHHTGKTYGFLQMPILSVEFNPNGHFVKNYDKFLIGMSNKIHENMVKFFVETLL